jgi:hypothetical protein
VTAPVQVPLSLAVGSKRGNRTLRVVAPKTRGDCKGGERPCEHVSCRFHVVGCIANLADENAAVNAMAARIEGGITATCALDVADEGEHTDAVVAAVMGVSTQRVQQICDEAGRYARKFGVKQQAAVRGLLRTADEVKS